MAGEAEETEAVEPTPEGGVVYTGPSDPEPIELDDDDMDDPDGDRKGEEEPKGDGAEEDPKPEDEPDGDPPVDTPDPMSEIEKLREENKRLMAQFEGFTKAQQNRPGDAPTKQEIRKYQAALKEYVDNGGDEKVAGRLQKIFDAHDEEIRPEITELKSTVQWMQEFLAQQSSMTEQQTAERQMREELAATDDELKLAEKEARDYYRKVADGQAAFKTYDDLYERAILRARHKGRKQATEKDTKAEKDRLEAQRRAGQDAGGKDQPTGPAKVPKGARGDFSAMMRHWERQGIMVED